MPKHTRKRQKLSASTSESKEGQQNMLEALIDDANKDEEERRLENLLFGTTFNAKDKGKGKSSVWKDDEDGEESEEEVGGREMENLLDGDLFFIDSGENASNIPTFSNSDQSEPESESDEEDNASPSQKPKLKSGKAPAWHDPSDPTTVSLSSSKRLRKLRNAPDEDELAGREYERRLRRQFEKINPEPEWARKARAKGKKVKATRDDQDDHVSEEEQEIDMQTLLNSTSGILSRPSKSAILPAGTINIERLRDANISSQGSGGCGDIKSLAFHPSDRVPVLAVGSEDRRVRVYNIDGHTSPLLTTLHIPSLPLSSQSSVQFHPGGTHILLTGSRPYFFTYDLQSGMLIGGANGSGSGKSSLWGTRFGISLGDDPSTRVEARKRSRDNLVGSSGSNTSSGGLEISSFSPDGSVLAVAGRGGYVHLLDWSQSSSSGGIGSGQVVGSLKCSGTGGGVRGIWWVPSSASSEPVLGSGAIPSSRQHLAVLTGDSEIYLWDVVERRCAAKWRDEGGFRGSGRVLAGSSNSSGRAWMGVGSNTGLVNIYDSSTFFSSTSTTASRPKPMKTLEHLTTPISSMRFNHDSQLLAVASREKKDAMKLYHLPSLTSYSNFPTSSTPLGHVSSIAFSPRSEYLAVGNKRGRVLLWSLRGYCA
ncbi:U3 snoRNP protein [Stygiomarasmius scandens]|uniref:U3 snoRNP protein n=1 Tax=Marasmiellus scandens TaxID=2682957 RepID=A0ABR1K5C4_9AGAR